MNCSFSYLKEKLIFFVEAKNPEQLLVEFISCKYKKIKTSI
jgi:hypothetical protein